MKYDPRWTYGCVLRPWYKPSHKNQVKSLQYLKGNSQEKSHKKISKCLDKPFKYLFLFFCSVKNEPLNLLGQTSSALFAGVKGVEEDDLGASVLPCYQHSPFWEIAAILL